MSVPGPRRLGGEDRLDEPVDRGDRGRSGPELRVGPLEPFTAADAWPSFERTPTDNIWRGGEDD